MQSRSAWEKGGRAELRDAVQMHSLQRCTNISTSSRTGVLKSSKSVCCTRVQESAISDSVSWSIGLNGTTRHKPTGIAISERTGIDVPGHRSQLADNDVEMESTRLGSGACGVVAKGVITQGRIPVAIETLEVDTKEGRQELPNELGSLSEVKSPCVVHFH